MCALTVEQHTIAVVATKQHLHNMRVVYLKKAQLAFSVKGRGAAHLIAVTF